MNHPDARLAIDSLFSGERPSQAELRAHLDGCLECRGYYDSAVKLFRAASGRPDEMTEEELWLFAPAFPEVEAPQGFRISVWLTGALTVALTAAVVFMFVTRPKDDDGFGARGTTPVATRPSMRVFCLRDGQVAGEPSKAACADGDTMMFSAVSAGKKYVAVVLDEGGKLETVAESLDGELGLDPERVLMKTSPWRPGLRGLAVFGDQPVTGEVARACIDSGKCAAGLERYELALGSGR